MAKRGRPITHRYDEVYEYIVKYKKAHDGNSPSMREIMQTIGISSTGHARHILNRLVTQGKIRLVDNKMRSIEVVGGEWRLQA